MKWVLLALWGLMSFGMLFGFPEISGNVKLLAIYIGSCIILAAEYVEAAIERIVNK